MCQPTWNDPEIYHSLLYKYIFACVDCKVKTNDSFLFRCSRLIITEEISICLVLNKTLLPSSSRLRLGQSTARPGQLQKYFSISRCRSLVSSVLHIVCRTDGHPKSKHDIFSDICGSNQLQQYLYLTWMMNHNRVLRLERSSSSLCASKLLHWVNF